MKMIRGAAALATVVVGFAALSHAQTDRQSERTALQAGDAVALDIATEHAHWFDSAGRVVAAAAPTAA